MNHLLEGIGIGIGLSIMTGPLLFTLIQTSLDRGARAGFSVALGIWISDIAIILFSLQSLSLIRTAMGNEIFFRGLGIIGGGILIATGLSFILSNPIKNIRQGRSVNKKNLLGYFIVGILINGVNPFTIVFWLGLLTTYVAPLTKSEVSHVLLGIMGTIILTDSLKVILAKRISKKLKRRLIIKLRRIAGIILVICGIGLIVRVMFY